MSKKLAQHINEINSTLMKLNENKIVSESVSLCVHKLLDRMISHNEVQIWLCLDDIFENATEDKLFSVEKYIKLWEKVATELIDLGFQIDNFKSYDDDFEVTFSPKD